MAWLVCNDRVLATVEIATGWRERALGLLGRDEFDKALLLRPAFSVHTLGMRFPIDVAYLDRDLVVLKAATMGRFRIGLPVWRARAVLEAEAGSFARWGLKPGDHLQVRQTASEWG
ncbi:MAG: DUF192 domain-containing protein [bacterium]|nr:DUF192 domain-containing protein [bacterium]MCY3889164.1 DUF192 domain-containing protein [bacterium]MCY3960454.1 DUF192 domain-containing protein [bacterium]MCY4135282.1 DUF192 domain-containing protein [bacterium]